jgi:hypothetical protein
MPPPKQIRIKDLVEFDGVRGNDLVGYGLVVGLNGTGDGMRNAPFTEEIMANLLERLGANVTGEEFRPKNVAAVFVTAALPPFARRERKDRRHGLGHRRREKPAGRHLGHDTAERGRWADLCRGAGTIIAGGIAAEGEGARVVQGVPTAGVIPRAPGSNARSPLTSQSQDVLAPWPCDLPDGLTLGPVVAIDTETMGLDPRRDRLCVVQLSGGDGNAHLVQIARGQTRAPNLERLLADPAVLKLFHFGRFDIAALKRAFGVTTAPVWCTKIASKLIRTFTDRHGLKYLLADLVGVDVSKQQQTSDWGAET